MSWSIRLNSKNLEYYIGDETFYVSIRHSSSNFHEEPSSGYQEPNDIVLESVFNAESEHGSFKWLVVSRRTGFNSFAEIDDIQFDCPDKVEDLVGPEFSIINN